MDTAPSGAPGVIVVAEPSIHDLLISSGAGWNVQPRQPTVSAMWDGLSGGRLDAQSRILVFSDSMGAGESMIDQERRQTAAAIAAMSGAGAVVFVANWRPDDLPALQDLVTDAAVAQNIDPNSLAYTVLPVAEGGRVMLEMMRSALAGQVEFPASLPPGVDVPLAQDGGSSPAAPAAPAVPAGAPVRPKLPPISAADVPVAVAPEEGIPAAASMELLSQPKRDGQVTITVTSAKGGSGKSTVSLMLAGSIVRASREAGRPLSVCLVDLDTRDGQVASLIGQFMPTALNIRVQPVWDEPRIRRNLVEAPELGISTLLAPIRPRTADTVGPDFYRAIVRSLQRMFDVIVMDTSVQYLDPLIAEVALVEADEILFVTTLASTAVQGMARAMREITTPVEESGLGIPREKIGIVVNQSVANVGMERDQILAAGLGVPVVGVVPLATKDVLTATNFNRMHTLLDHPTIGPAYNDLARACLPGHELSTWEPDSQATSVIDTDVAVSVPEASGGSDSDSEPRRRGIFRR